MWPAGVRVELSGIPAGGSERMFNKNTHISWSFSRFIPLHRTSDCLLKITWEIKASEKREYEKCILSSQNSDFFCHCIVFPQDSERDFYFSNNIQIEFVKKKKSRFLRKKKAKFENLTPSVLIH